MKTKLPKRSLIIKERLDEIVEEILAVAKDQLAMIILFGSYAKGTWVNDRYVEDNILYSYESDVDIMVVTKSSKYRGYQGRALQSRLEERLMRKGLYYKPKITFITETIQHVNTELEKSRYFYSDIKKEGILLYDSGEFKLAEARDLSWNERKEIAKDDFDQWFPHGNGFLRDINRAIEHNDLKLERGDFKRAAFYLHQATESFYNAILLVFTGYKGKIHDILTLGSLAANYNEELLKIFPRDTKERNECFILLQKAYIDARYDKKYRITQEQLLYLIKRVEKLKSVTEEICNAWINQEEVL